jgi:hypothetical protein
VDAPDDAKNRLTTDWTAKRDAFAAAASVLFVKRAAVLTKEIALAAARADAGKRRAQRLVDAAQAAEAKIAKP